MVTVCEAAERLTTFAVTNGVYSVAVFGIRVEVASVVPSTTMRTDVL